MALNIPMPQLPGQALMEGLNTGGQLFSRIMQPIIQREQLAETGQYHRGTLEHYREQLAQQAKHQAEQMALARQAEGRMGANAKLERQLAGLRLQKLMREADPAKQVAYIKQLLQASHGGQPMNQGQPQNIMQQFSGQGMPSVEEMENPRVQPPSQEAIQGGLTNLSPEDQMILGMSGIKIPKISETPEQKRAGDLQSKMQLAKYNHEQKIEQERVKNELKNDQTRQKTIESAKNDLPHLKATLMALERMQKIAEHNPDMFGHNGIFGFGAEGDAERFAKTSDNPNVGHWQTYGLGPIVAAETKMSSRGNQLALKQALANKANFSETQPVALGKIKSNIQQIKEQIGETEKIAGYQNGSKNKTAAQYKPEQKVKVDMGNGNIEIMTYKEAQEKGYT